MQQGSVCRVAQGIHIYMRKRKCVYGLIVQRDIQWILVDIYRIYSSSVYIYVYSVNYKIVRIVSNTV